MAHAHQETGFRALGRVDRQAWSLSALRPHLGVAFLTFITSDKGDSSGLCWTPLDYVLSQINLFGMVLIHSLQNENYSLLIILTQNNLIKCLPNVLVGLEHTCWGLGLMLCLSLAPKITQESTCPDAECPRLHWLLISQ